MAQTPYPVPTGKTELTASFSFQTYDQFFDSSRSVSLSAFGIKQIDQYSANLYAEHGLSEDVTLDLMLGWTWATMNTPLVAGQPAEIDGLNDTVLGLRWRFLDEQKTPSLPTLALRVGGTLGGSYESGFINSPGKGASGAEYGLLLGKYYEACRTGIYSSLLHKLFDGSAPDQLHFGLGIYYLVSDRISIFANYRRIESLSGVDFDSPAFNLGRFRELREKSDNLEYGVGYTDAMGRNYGLTLYHVLDGSNSAKKFGLNASVSIPF